ncbi:probable aspartic proteinase GIP1 [Rosa rugosa]|uniref:probable aspartic proteinase GIP1 n=1 Tax=Rosa rugosa TaxID=74645 RepID=UPI002B408EBE|nr:probable aspartic proteinase GIP1 [Rosa rugosa]
MPSPNTFLLLPFLLFMTSPSLSLPPALVAPISKDHSTLLYSLSLYLKTPLQPTKLHLDLGAAFTWLDCTKPYYNSSTYLHVPCGSPLCDSFHSFACGNCYEPPGPHCANDTCSLYPENPVSGKATLDNALLDALALHTTDGSAPGRLALLPQFAFSCSTSSLLKGLAKKVNGLVALGRSNHSLPAQVSTALSLPHYFALCLSGSVNASGAAFLGSKGPYIFNKIDVSKSLIYTPLVLNPVTRTVVKYGPSDEYFIGLTAIKVNGKTVPLNNTLLSIDQDSGFGGTTLTTDAPYTVMETSIFKAFVELFVRESSALNLTRTNVVKPFGVCYLAKDIVSTRAGPAVPTVDLLMEREDVIWRILGTNSMVKISKKGGVELWCLGFVDGGAKPRSSIMIGGHQMEDNLLQFDLESKRLGFSSSVLLQGTKCADFNFASAKVNL